MKKLLWMNNDDDFLDGIIAVIDMLVHQFGYNNKVCIKDVNSRYLYASTEYIDSVLGSKLNPDQITGKSDIDLNVFPGTDFGTTGEKEDLEVIQENQMIVYLKIYPYPTGIAPLLFNKAALINKNTGNKVGTVTRVLDIGIKNLISKILEAHQIKLGAQNLAKNAKDYKLTRREQQVVFLFMANFTSQDIATIISQIEQRAITKTYIDKVFSQQLYIKFEVNDRKALYDKLRMLKFDEHVPTELLRYCSIRISQISKLLQPDF